jgi:hypothetical protein
LAPALSADPSRLPLEFDGDLPASGWLVLALAMVGIVPASVRRDGGCKDVCRLCRSWRKG